MDDISKFVKRLSPSQRKRVIALVVRIMDGELSGLDIKRLRGHEGVFRVRVGRIRIIYCHTEEGVELLQISFRSEGTYR